MNHYLFDALKISPVPLETANKVTEVGWMLEIEMILNNILNTSEESYDKHFLELSEKVKKDIEEYKAALNQVILESIYAESNKEMVRKEIYNLLGDVVSYITFGVDDDGYLFITVPEKFEDVKFSYVSDCDSEDYGKIIIEY